MSHVAAFLLCASVLAALLLSSGCTQARQGSGVPVSETTAAVTTVSPAMSGAGQASKDELVSFVKSAVAYAKTNGKEKALAAFDQANGTFFQGELYIYAYDFNGTTIAHPVNPEKIGVNRINETDAAGNLFIKELRDTALNGSGFVEYYYVNPTHANAVERKLGYVEKVDNRWWLGSGIYDGPAGVLNPTQPSITVSSRVPVNQTNS